MPENRLAGKWYSGIGSTLELEVEGSLLRGSFESVEYSPSKKFPLVGVVDADEGRPNRSLAFVISWIDDDPLRKKYRRSSSYTGQFHSDDDVNRVTSLIVNETAEKKQYASILVSHDVFTRDVPSR